MVVSSPGTHRMTSWPTLRIWISTIAGCLQALPVAPRQSPSSQPGLRLSRGSPSNSTLQGAFQIEPLALA